MGRKLSILSFAFIVILSSCGEKEHNRAFPETRVPSVYVSDEQIISYLGNHYWDEFLKEGTFRCDSVTANGVSDIDLSNAALKYSQILLSMDLESSQKALLGTLSKMEKFQEAYPRSNVFVKMKDLLCSIEYDPNSPWRDEDIYGPFARALSLSAFCPEELKKSYMQESLNCALNSRGTKAADFEYVDMEGRTRTLYETKADILILNFINPGCHACEEVVSAFRDPAFVNLIEEGRVCVLGMYIDEEIDKWFESREELPAEWICGYDPYQSIRGDRLYDVRAIPSIYVLDRDKTVLLKDAPVDRTLNFLQTILL